MAITEAQINLFDGAECRVCHNGIYRFQANPKYGGCSCHIRAPCGACEDGVLVCWNCGHLIEEKEPQKKKRG